MLGLTSNQRNFLILCLGIEVHLQSQFYISVVYNEGQTIFTLHLKLECTFPISTLATICVEANSEL